MWIFPHQTTYAMQGDQVVRSFLVSTGRWPTVTIEGVFKIYVKYRHADMTGDDYFLPDVPYVMYFFKGYGLHGTYWHNNFGTPMSHGCVKPRFRRCWLVIRFCFSRNGCECTPVIKTRLRLKSFLFIKPWNILENFIEV